MSAFRAIILLLVASVTLAVCHTVSVCHADDDASRPPAPTKPRRPISDVLPRQLGDDVTLPFVPKSPAMSSDASRQKAVAHFMAGQIKEGREDFKGAMAEYEKAIKSDKTRLPPYQALVTLAFAQTNEPDKAKKYALEAAEQTEGGIDLVRGIAALMVRSNSSEEAVALLEQVLKTAASKGALLPQLLVRRDLGLFSRLSGDTDKAVTHYRKVFDELKRADSALDAEGREQLLGDAGSTYEEMGKVFLDAKLPDLAVAAFDEASKFNKGRPGVHSFNLAMVYKETGKAEKALDKLNEYFDAQLQTKGRAAYQLLKELLDDADQSDDLLPRLEEMHDEDSRNIALRYFLAEAYQDADQLDEAEELLKETLGNGADPRGLVGLSRLYQQKSEAKLLLGTLRKAYQVIPQPDEDEVLERMDADTRAVVTQFRDIQSDIAADAPLMDKLVALGQKRKADEQGDFVFIDAYLLAKLSAQAERTDDAAEFYQTAIDMQNDPPAALYRELGLLLSDAERYGEAADVFDAALTHPSPRLQSAGIRSFFRYLQSHALEMDGQTDAALAAIREARAANPDNVGLHFQEAWVHYHAHHWDDAIAEFNIIIKAYGDNDDEDARRTVKNSRFSLSAIYVQQGNEAKGEEVLLEVYREDPEDTQVNNDLGYLWAEQGVKLDQAKAMIEKALAAEPDNAAYLDSMGWVLYKLEAYEAAQENLEKAASLPRGEDSTIHDHLGDVYDKLDQHDKAIEMWRKALKLEEDQPHPNEKIVERVKAKLPKD